MKQWRKVIALALVFLFVLALPVYAKPDKSKKINSSGKKIERKTSKNTDKKLEKKSEEKVKQDKDQNKKAEKKVKLDKDLKKKIQEKLKLERELEKQQQLELEIDEQLFKKLQKIDEQIGKIQKKYDEITEKIEHELYFEIDIPEIDEENQASDIKEFKLEIITMEGKCEYEYVVNKDEILSRIERELKDLKEQLEGQEAAEIIQELFKDISYDQEAEVIVEKILSALEITDFDYLKVEINFDGDQEIEITVGEIDEDEGEEITKDSDEEEEEKEEADEDSGFININGYVGKLNALHNRLDAVKNQLNSLERKFGSDNEEIDFRYDEIQKMQENINIVIEDLKGFNDKVAEEEIESAAK